MKIRQSFVTNSSSSSYVVKYKVKLSDLHEVLSTIKNEYGNKGLTKLFSDMRGIEDDKLVFGSGKEEDLKDMFYSLSSNLYDNSEGSNEYW